MLDTLVAAVSPELADAVAIALALDPRERYQTAREMGRAISDGAHGISPRRRLPRALGERGAAQPATQATSVLRAAAGRAAPGPSPPSRRVSRDTARPEAPAAAASARPATAAAAASSSQRGQGPRRLAVALLGLLAVVGVIVAIVVITAPAPTTSRAAQRRLQRRRTGLVALKQLVTENTK